MELTLNKKIITTACVGAMLAFAASANAADKVKLRVADSFPAGHYIPDAMTKPFMEEVTKLTNGEVEFEYYPAEQMGKSKDMLSLTQSGVVDIGYIAPAFVSDKMPLGVVAELPGGFADSCHGTRAYWELAKPGGILDEKEFKPLGIKVLFSLVLPPYQIFLGKDKMDSLDSLAGLKIRTSGGAKDIAARKLNLTPIQMATPEVYEGLSRGTIDGMLFPYSSITSYDLQVLTKASSVGENFGSFIVNYAINEKSWNKLSPEAQNALVEVGTSITERGCEISQQREMDDMKVVEAAGSRLVEFSPEDKAKIAELMANVSTEWAETLDKRGRPGTEILEAYNEALKK